MGQSAHVESIDALKHFRVALWKFSEAANVALGDAEADLHRTLSWLENEQLAHWQGQVRKRTELVSRAKEAVRMKKVFKNAVGGRDSVVDEEKALAAAMRALQEAEQKLVSTKQWSRRLQKEILLYKGQVQRFSTSVQSDIPVAVSKLDGMVTALEAYVGLNAGGEQQNAAMAPGDLVVEPIAEKSSEQENGGEVQRNGAKEVQ
jgi:hypothetical protein